MIENKENISKVSNKPHIGTTLKWQVKEGKSICTWSRYRGNEKSGNQPVGDMHSGKQPLAQKPTCL